MGNRELQPRLTRLHSYPQTEGKWRGSKGTVDERAKTLNSNSNKKKSPVKTFTDEIKSKTNSEKCFHTKISYYESQSETPVIKDLDLGAYLSCQNTGLLFKLPPQKRNTTFGPHKIWQMYFNIRGETCVFSCSQFVCCQRPNKLVLRPLGSLCAVCDGLPCTEESESNLKHWISVTLLTNLL